MKYAFFCDTGILYGRCYPSDTHHEACKKFLKKYPISRHEYFYPKIVLDELDNHKRKLDRSNKLNKRERGYARTFQQCIDRLVAKMEEFDANSKEEFIDDFQQLLKELPKVIDAITYNQLNDVEIIANAIIWSLITRNDKKTLITVDGLDLSNNQDKIIEKAINTAKCPITLEIIYVPSLFN